LPGRLRMTQQPAGFRASPPDGCQPCRRGLTRRVSRALKKLGYIGWPDHSDRAALCDGRPSGSHLARELVALRLVIVCVGRQETRAGVTRTIPIVFMQVNDPVEQGFARFWPGQAATQRFTQMSAELDSNGWVAARDRPCCRVRPFGQPKSHAGSPGTVCRAEAAANSLASRCGVSPSPPPAELTAAFAEIEESSSRPC